jgi:pilus assembly protein CpaE
MLKQFTKSSDDTVAIRLVTASQDLARRLGAIFEQDTRFAMAGVTASVAEAEAAAAGSAGRAILLAELDTSNSEELAALERMMNGSGNALAVVAIVDTLSEATVRKLLQLRVTDLVSKRDSQQDLIKACERALQSDTGQSRFGGATCSAFVSAGGGAGNTSLAIQSAFVVARDTGQYQSTCLIDMDFQRGAVIDYLDLEPNLQIDEIAPTPDRLDEQLLEVMVSRHDTGLAVLAAKNALRSYESIGTDFVTHMLDLASIKFDNLILDMPRVWLPWSRSVLQGSDNVFVVTEMTVPGLRQARRLADALVVECGDELKIGVIVNRFKKTLWGGINAVRRQDAEDVLGSYLAGFVAQDYPLVREAIDRGVPLHEIDKHNRIDKDLGEILLRKKPEADNLQAPAAPGLIPA